MKFGAGSARACPCQVPGTSFSWWVLGHIPGPRERHGPRTPGGQLPGARRGPGPRRPAPLPARPPGALGRVLRPLRARPARCPRRPRPATRCLPLRPHRPARRHRRPGGPPLAWGSPQPTPRPAPGRSSAITLAGRAAPGVARPQRPGGPGGRSHPGGPGSPGGGGAVGPRDRGPAAADGRRPQCAVRAAETRGAAETPPLTLEGPVQSHHGTPALTQGPQSPDGAQLGACTRLVDVGDLGGRTLPPPDTLASTGDFFCTM
uniref:BCL2 binding component 3 n=1 Tax=Propithecus coquereli TaxID=379532 RepID=A0A2K6FR14_PROCO